MSGGPLAWEAWPLRNRPGRGLFAALVVVGSCWGTWLYTGSAVLTGLALAVLAASTGSFFFPTRYRLSADGVEIARPWHTRSRPWEDFRGVRVGRGVVVLSPYARESWLDGFRGETLLLPADGGKVLEYVEEMVDPEAGARAG